MRLLYIGLLSFLLILSWGACSKPSVDGPTVTIQPSSGTITPGTEIRFIAKGATSFYYTLDETTPKPDYSSKYETPLRVWSSVVVKVIAIDAEKRQGPVAQAVYRLDNLFPRTEAMPASGHYREKIAVSITSDEQAKIFYSTKEPPTQKSSIYKGPFIVSEDTTLYFFGVDKAGNQEPLQKRTYNFPPKLTLSPPEGLYDKSPQKVTITSNEKDTRITYFREGIDVSWRTFRTPLSLEYNTRLQVRGIDRSGVTSDVALHDFVFLQPFKKHPISLPKQHILAVASADLEGLAQLGVVFATKDRLFVAPLGPKEFSSPASLAKLDFETKWIRSWDIDGDGLNDIILGDTSKRLHLYLSQSGTEVKKDEDLLRLIKGASVQSLVPLDYNGDGQLDLFVLDSRAKESRLLLRQRDGYALLSPIVPYIDAGAAGALAADFDADNTTDLLILPGKKEEPYVLFGQGNGAFEKHSLKKYLPSKMHGVTWLHAARCDADGDGELDLFLLGRREAVGKEPAHLELVILLHLDGPHWKMVYGLALPDAPVRSLVVVDLDSNGYPDAGVFYEKHEPSFMLNFQGKRWVPLPPKWFPKEIPNHGPVVVGHMYGTGPHQLFFYPSDEPPIWLAPQGSPRYLHFFVRGTRNNRNAIGTRIQIKTNRSLFLRELGIRSTSPDQSALTLPIPLHNEDKINKVEFRWSDKQKREIPAPTEKKMLIIQPN